MPNTTFHTFNDIESYLSSLGLFHMDFSLARMKLITNELFPGGIPFVSAQVVGTNGKGSTSTFLSSLATAHAIRNGLYTSPHFLSVKERIRINGKMLDDAEWVTCASLVASAMKRLESGGQELALTWFEFVTAISMLAFARGGAELAIFEAGLGGELDATTILPHKLLLFTPIAMDHEEVLGKTLAEIAKTKAAAMKEEKEGQRGQIVLTAPQEEEVLAILKSTATGLGLKLLTPAKDDNRFASFITMPGAHQFANASLALAGFSLLAREFDWKVRVPAIIRGMKRAFIAGRFQRIKGFLNRPEIILDGAHNPHSLNSLLNTLEGLGLKPRAIVFACLADKNIPAMLKLLGRLKNTPVFVPPIPGNPRAMPPSELAAQIKQTGQNAMPVSSFKKALHMALNTPILEDSMAENATENAAKNSQENAPVLVCGSLYLLAEYYRLHPSAL